MLHIQQLIGFGAGGVEGWGLARSDTITTSTSNLTTYTLSASLGAPAADREVVIVAMTIDTSAGNPTATLNGVAMTRDVIQQRTGGNVASVAIFRLANAWDTDGTVAVTWPGAATSCAIVAYRMTGRTQSVTAGGAEGGSGAATDTVTVKTGGTTVLGWSSGTTNAASWTGATGDQSTTLESNVRYATATKTGSSGSVTAQATGSAACALAWAAYG